MADVIVILSFIHLWQMLSHMIGMLQQLKMADVIAKWQMEDNFQIIGREGHDIDRTVNKSIYNRVNNLTLNRNVGKFNLHHI